MSVSILAIRCTLLLNFWFTNWIIEPSVSPHVNVSFRWENYAHVILGFSAFDLPLSLRYEVFNCYTVGCLNYVNCNSSIFLWLLYIIKADVIYFSQIGTINVHFTICSWSCNFNANYITYQYCAIYVLKCLAS